ncbi:MAG: oxaloacetate decarboxylase subunit alpha [Bacilli bacterium]
MVKITETVLRDGQQSLIATRLKTEDILPVVEILDKAGYHSLEVWGGATMDSCIRFLNEDPWDRLREIKKRAKNTKLQMLLRGQNLLGYRHYSDEIVEKFIEKSIENGIDIIRVFDALNDVRNLKASVDAINKYGGHCQIALSYTVSPVHTVEYYVELAKEVEKMGADSLCIKDMAGIMLPSDATKLISALKKNSNLEIQLHTHATAGISEMLYLKAIEAGVDIIDTALSVFAGGTSQPATESLYYALEGTEYDLKLNIKYLEEAVKVLTPVRNKFVEEGGLNPKALMLNPGILKYQVPGGMLSNLMSQLTQQNAMDKYEEVLEEIPSVRADLGYPPLVTPMSQMVGTQAVMNILMGERYKMCPTEVRDYVSGKYGKSPVDISEAIVQTIIGDGERINIRPADLLTETFEDIKKECSDIVTSDEDVLTYAMFPTVAREYFESSKDEVIEITLHT